MIQTWIPNSDRPSPAEEPGYKVVKAWFQQCRDGAAAVEAQREKIQRIRDVSEKITPNMTGMPGGSGAGDKIGRAVTDIVDEERQLQRMETELCNLRMEATRRAYYGVDSKAAILQADCVRMFYAENKRQPEIVDALKLCENSEVSKLIRRRCEWLATVWDSFDV